MKIAISNPGKFESKKPCTYKPRTRTTLLNGRRSKPRCHIKALAYAVYQNSV